MPTYQVADKSWINKKASIAYVWEASCEIQIRPTNKANMNSVLTERSFLDSPRTKKLAIQTDKAWL